MYCYLDYTSVCWDFTDCKPGLAVLYMLILIWEFRSGAAFEHTCWSKRSARLLLPFRPTLSTCGVIQRENFKSWLSAGVEVWDYYSGLESKNLVLKTKTFRMSLPVVSVKHLKVFPILHRWRLPLVKLCRKLYYRHFRILGQKRGWLNCNPKLCREKLG